MQAAVRQINQEPECGGCGAGLGSVTAITDDTGMPVKYYHYDPFGNVTNTTEDPINNFTFVGRYGGYKDWQSGFINFHNRWYDSELGKWISRDPIGEMGGMNLYAYAANNPVNLWDVTGLCPVGPVPTPTVTYTPTPGPTGGSPYTGGNGNNGPAYPGMVKCIFDFECVVELIMQHALESLKVTVMTCILPTLVVCLPSAALAGVGYGICVVKVYTVCNVTTTIAGSAVFFDNLISECIECR